MTIPSYYPYVLFALAVWREMRGESFKAKLACAWVIKNRTLDRLGRWPKTVTAVILQPRQFSAFNQGDPNATKFPPEGDRSFEECCRAVDDCLSGAADPTKGATHYHALPASECATWPDWAQAVKLTTIIGDTKFYKL